MTKELLKFSNTNNQLKALADGFNTSAGKYEELKSELNITKNCNLVPSYIRG